MIGTALRERIKELMVDFGLNQTQLAKKTGIGVSTISKLLSEPKKGSKPTNVKLSTLRAVAMELDCVIHLSFEYDPGWVDPNQDPGW